MDQARERGLPRLGITITAFPVAGGVRSVLGEVHRALEDTHDVHYYTARPGSDGGRYQIHRFGNITANPFAFPDALVYALAGMWALWKGHREQRFSALLAQDGLYTGLFTAIIGRLTGTRVIIMDHGTAVLASSRNFRAVKARQPHADSDVRGPLARLHRLSAPVRRRIHMALLPVVLRATTKVAPEFLLVGQEVVDVYQRQLGVCPDRIRRYTYTVDADRYAPVAGAERDRIRSEFQLPADVVVITMVNRLAPEKGLETAVPAIADAMRQSGRQSALAIGGSGPMRRTVERMVEESGIENRIRLLGDLSGDQVARLLSASDIFVYAGTQGTNISAAVLEGMASGCAIVATPIPVSNESLLAGGRGLIVPKGDLSEMRSAVVQLIENDALRVEIAGRARAHVRRFHSLATLRRMLEHI